MGEPAAPIRILIVEDEAKLAANIQRGLREQGFTAEIAGDGESAVRQAAAKAYDLVILDVVLPGVDGFSVCRDLRRLNVDLPVLMLSARGVVEDRVKGLESGADDYLTKPFAFSELQARIRALLRRRRPTELLLLSVDDLVLDPVRHTVHRGARKLDLSPKEFALLEYLLRHSGEVLTRAMISEHVWDFTWDRLTNVIDVHVNRLRRKLEDGGAARLIHAVRGIGYVIRAPEK